MDSRTFDRLVAEAVRRPSRRTALRLLVGGLAGGLFAQRGSAFARAAQRLDQDGDGLYDDDESLIYGTDPYGYDTDGDAVGDGEEVYYGTNPIVAEDLVLAEPPPANGGEVAIGDVNDGCDPGPNPPGCYCVVNGQCVIADSGPITCRAIGTPCDYDSQCCNTPSVHCCFDGTYLRTQCTDVTAYGGACL